MGTTDAIIMDLLNGRAAIKAGRGDHITPDNARSLLNGLTVAELRDVAEGIGAPTAGLRSRAQMVDRIVASAVTAPRKHRGLREG